MRHVWRLTLAVLVAAVAMLTLATVASADSIKFHTATASIDNAGNLVCSFRATGLGTTTESADVSCSANATATYACINGGQNHPKAANKATVGGPVTNGGEFPVRNGQVSGDITVAPPGPGSFSCPSGQRLVLASVSYTNITITVEGVTTSTSPSTVSRTLVDV
jgi:hypothetical protein